MVEFIMAVLILARRLDRLVKGTIIPALLLFSARGLCYLLVLLINMHQRSSNS